MWVFLSDIAPTTPFGCFHMYYDQQSWQSTVFFIQFILMLIEMQSWHEHCQWHEFSLGSDHDPAFVAIHGCAFVDLKGWRLLWGATLPARPGERRKKRYIWKNPPGNSANVTFLGMVKMWRFQGLSDVQLGDQKVTLKNWIAWHMVSLYDSCHWITNDILWYF